MWSYMGSKSKTAHMYPRPQYDRIIEPFAGSARYSLLHWQKQVFLFDVNPMIVALWQYLIEASPRDIHSLPDVPSKVSLDSFTQLTETERNLIGFHMCRGKAKPRKVGHGQNDWNQAKVRIANDLYKIRHWKVEQKHYADIPDIEGTHFIDPPYQQTCHKGNGDRYPTDPIDYEHLAWWILSRDGQVIACEGPGADYLPFEPLVTVKANTNNRNAKSFEERVFML